MCILCIIRVLAKPFLVPVKGGWSILISIFTTFFKIFHNFFQDFHNFFQDFHNFNQDFQNFDGWDVEYSWGHKGPPSNEDLEWAAKQQSIASLE